MNVICANPLAQNKSYLEEIQVSIQRVINSNRYILGPEVEALEAEFAEFIGAKYSIGVANGTDAIELALRALDIGIDSEVITVSHTAVATVAAIEATGAMPVLVDVEPDYFTIDPAKLEQAYSKKTKAVIAVHLYGQSCNLDSIEEFCKKYNLYLIEDVSQAHGAKWNQRRLGSIGIIGCFSCYPTKNLGAIGDGGLVTTNDSSLASKIKMIREYGWRERYVSDIIGRNSRLDELQAAVLRVKLKHLDEDNAKRNTIANLYFEELKDVNVSLPKLRLNSSHVFHLFVLKVDNREELISHMKANQVYPGIHYPMPIHKQPAYRDRVRIGEMEITEKLAQVVLSLPMYPELSSEEAKFVIDVIKRYEKLQA